MATKNATKNTTNLGAFLSQLALKADTASAATIKNIQDRLTAEKQEKIERAVLGIADQIDVAVKNLKEIRNRERQTLNYIKELELRANAIVSGEIEVESPADTNSLGALLREKLEKEKAVRAPINTATTRKY